MSKNDQEFTMGLERLVIRFNVDSSSINIGNNGESLVREINGGLAAARRSWAGINNLDSDGVG